MGSNVGIDVSKHSLEWCEGGLGTIQHVRNEPRPIARKLLTILNAMAREKTAWQA